MLRLFLAALALMLMCEGLFPLLFPRKWREMMTLLLAQTDKMLRTFAFILFLIGVSLWYLVGHTGLID